MRGWIGVGLAALLVGTPNRASANDANACISAFESAQRSAVSGKLVDARRFYDVCAAPTCPQLVRSDCVKGRDDVERAMPTASFVLRDASNVDVAGVAELDGHSITTFGRAIPLDPGDHVVTYGRAGGPRREARIRMAEGEKARLVPLYVTDTGTAEPASDAGSSRTAGWVVLGSGAAVFVTGAVVMITAQMSFASTRDDIQTRYAANKCTAGSKDAVCVDLEDQFNANRDSGTRKTAIGGVVAGVGAIAAGIGLYMVLHARPSAKATDASIVPLLGAGFGGASLVGRF